VLGVFSPDLIEVVANTLAELGVHRAFVVHGAGSLDEISLCGESRVAEVRNGRVRHFTVTPEDFGVARAPLEALRGGTPVESAQIIGNILHGVTGAPHDIVVINAAAALVVTGVAEDFQSASILAATAISSGAALAKLERLRDFSQDYEAKL
jgi:anthranilate phosphoribosyltransferase